MLTGQVFPWMSFYRHMLLQPQVIRFDEENTERGALVGISGRSCSISAALPFALGHSDCSAEAEERCQQRLRPSKDPASGNPLSAKLLESVKTGLEIS